MNCVPARAAQEAIEAAVHIRFEGAYNSENDEFVSKLGSLAWVTNRRNAKSPKRDHRNAILRWRGKSDRRRDHAPVKSVWCRATMRLCCRR